MPEKEAVSLTLISTIPAEKQGSRGWTVEIDGVQMADVSHVRISNPRFGELEYGLTPGGYDGWAFHESGGGGSVIIPYAMVNGELYVGVVEQNRPNQGGKVLNVPRGFLSPGENHVQTAKIELQEEVGLARPVEILGLGGTPSNPNSAFFVTAGPDEGVKFFSALVNPEFLEPGTGGPYVFRPGMLKADDTSKAAKLVEQILGARFIPWTQAALVGDMFTIAAVARLLAHLKQHP